LLRQQHHPELACEAFFRNAGLRMDTQRSVVESSCGSISESDSIWDYGLGAGPLPVPTPTPDGVPKLTLPAKSGKAFWGASFPGAVFGSASTTEGPIAGRGPSLFTGGGQGFPAQPTDEEKPILLPPSKYASPMSTALGNSSRHRSAPSSGSPWPDTHPMSGGPNVRHPASKSVCASGGGQRPTPLWQTPEWKPPPRGEAPAKGAWWSTLLPGFAECRDAPIPSGGAGPLSACGVASQTAARTSPAVAGSQPKSLFSCSSGLEMPEQSQKSARSARHCGEFPKDRQNCTSLTDICEENIEDLLFRDATVELEETPTRPRTQT